MRRYRAASPGIAATSLLFVGAVATCAAACGDLLVESLSNHGFFGPGRFTDGSNVDIAPVGIVGSALLLGCLLFLVRHKLAGNTGTQYRRSLTAVLAPLTVAWMLPVILFLQIVLLWTMETSEQYLVIGHGLGGTIWLGAPTGASLLLHAAICLIVTFATRRLLSFLEPRAVRIIRRLLALTAFAPEAAIAVAGRPVLPRNPRESLLQGIAKRGPPPPRYCA
jgi:hypothetical protein